VVIYDLDFPLTPTLSHDGEREITVTGRYRKIASLRSQ